MTVGPKGSAGAVRRSQRACLFLLAAATVVLIHAADHGQMCDAPVDAMESCRAVASALGVEHISNSLCNNLRPHPTVSEALFLLVDQATHAPDYETLGKGWFYPATRVDYRMRQHEVFRRTESRDRQAASRTALSHEVSAIAAAESGTDSASLAEHAIVTAFLREIGALRHAEEWTPTFAGVRLALESELLMPLRALNECDLTSTYGGQDIPQDVISEAVAFVTRAVVEGNYPGALYEHPAASKQLEGLTPEQVSAWRTKSTRLHAGNLETVDEDCLEVFWATKIGGPSHGFDYEGQCLLPLITNARHKVILVKDPLYRHNSAGRSHLRVLHTADSREPILHLDPTNVDFNHGNADHGAYVRATVEHAMAMAQRMGISLSMDTHSLGLARELIHTVSGINGKLEPTSQRLLLAPSTGGMEASDTLTNKHDWVQTDEETTAKLSRVLFIPR